MNPPDEQVLRQRLAHILLPESGLEPFLQACMACTREVLKAGLDSFAPTLTIRVRNSQGEEQPLVIAQVATSFNEWPEKSAVLRHVGAMIHEKKWFPVAFALASEVWVSNQAVVQPRHDPKRREAICLAAGLLGSKARMVATLPVLRDGANKLVPGDWLPLSKGEVETALLDQLLIGFHADRLGDN